MDAQRKDSMENNDDMEKENRDRKNQNDNPGNFANDREKAREAGKKGGQH